MKVPVGGVRDSASACRFEAGHDFMVYSPTACIQDEADAAVAAAGSDAFQKQNDLIMDSVKALLQGLGEDPSRDGLWRTPLRVAKALRDATKGYGQKIKDVVGAGIFPEPGMGTQVGCGGGIGGLVVVKNIDHFSSCHACLLPFKVRFHLGYLSADQRVIGLSKLSRVAEAFAKRFQSPQKLAYEVTKALHETLRPQGVAALLECWHICCPKLDGNNTLFNTHGVGDLPGWMQFSVHTGTGVFENENSDYWSEFIYILKLDGINTSKSCFVASVVEQKSWCPFHSIDELYHLLTNDIKELSVVSLISNSKSLPKSRVGYLKMMAAVESIIHALGQDPRKEELQLTPFRFVWWLLGFCQTNISFEKDIHVQNVEDAQRQRMMETQDASCPFLFEINIPFLSQCEHHLLPFFGNAHVAYFAAEGDVELSRETIISVVQFYSQKLQVQERLTKQIAETIHSLCNTSGVIVLVEASHICMMSRGIEKMGSNTATTATLGNFVTDISAKALFFKKISRRH